MESKEAICAALRQLVLVQPFESISIQGVCDKAGLSRKTFSRNFADLQDVVRYQVYLDFTKPMGDFNRIMGVVDYESVLSFERNLAVLKANADYYLAVCRRFGSAWFAEQLAQSSLAIDFAPYARHRFGDTELSFVEHYCAFAVANAFRWWIDEGFATPREEVARLIDRWLYARFREMKAEGGR